MFSPANTGHLTGPDYALNWAKHRLSGSSQPFFSQQFSCGVLSKGVFAGSFVETLWKARGNLQKIWIILGCMSTGGIRCDFLF